MPQVVVDLGSGGTGRLSKLLTGECDVLAWPAASQLTILRDDPRLRLTLRPGMNIAYLAFNTDKPPLNNPAVRHALALAINNQRLMQSIYYGTAETAASILPRASWAYDGEAKITEYNPAKAREQLKALGRKTSRCSFGCQPAPRRGTRARSRPPNCCRQIWRRWASK
jgi:cationic peptide transport system substrate-binding protein